MHQSFGETPFILEATLVTDHGYLTINIAEAKSKFTELGAPDHLAVSLKGNYFNKVPDDNLLH